MDLGRQKKNVSSTWFSTDSSFLLYAFHWLVYFSGRLFSFLFFWLLLVFVEVFGLWLPHVWLSLVAARTSLVEHGF